MVARLSLSVLLLLAFPALAQSTAEPSWIADPRTGCKIWNPNPIPDEAISWSGGCANGVAQGHGALQWYKDGKPNERYEGGMRDVKLDGTGIVTFANGDRFEGEYRDSKKTGHGVYTWANGDRFDGEYRDDNRNGRGVIVLANGDRYEGEYRDGQRNGQGVYTWANGDRYEGEWSADKANGTGTYKRSNSEVYFGTWRNGCFSDGNRRAMAGATAKECGFE